MPHLEIFKEVGMKALRKKSVLLTGYLEFLINEFNKEERYSNPYTKKARKTEGCPIILIFIEIWKTFILMN